jgi:diguanylate cyclase (GGDEF)-like protein/PAS domain S-box-containing protein
MQESLMTLIPALPALPMLVTAAAVLMLGVVVIARERASTISISFLALTASVSTWLVGISMMYLSASARSAMVFARLAYIGVALIPAAVLHFTVALLDETRKRRVQLLLCWSTSIVFVALFTMTDLLLVGTWRYPWGFYPHLGAPTAAFLLFFALSLGSSLVLLLMSPSVSELERKRRIAFLTALAVGYIGSIDYFPAFGVSIYPLGFLPILGFLVLSARAILKFRLSDLSPSFVADQMMQAMQGGVIVVDLNCRVRVVNSSAADLLGYTLGDMRGADLCALLQVARLPSTDHDSFVRRSVSRNCPGVWRRKDGSEIELAISATALRDGAGSQVGVLYAISDLSDKRRADRNEFSATHDVLTRLPNRARLVQSFDEIRGIVEAHERVAGVFFLDLDGFKAINDTHGHATGDALLQIVASRLRNAVRGDDVIARIGGDEFVLLLNLARVADGTIVADKLLRVINDPFAIGDRRVSVTASIGAAFYPRDGADVETLIRAADTAMYTAKAHGKARLSISASPRTDVPSAPPFGIDARA